MQGTFSFPTGELGKNVKIFKQVCFLLYILIAIKKEF